MPDARAVKLWEKIKTNLVERGVLNLDVINGEAACDAEQIAAIEYALGIDREIKVYAAADSTVISFKINKTIPGAPVIEAKSKEFHADGGTAFISQAEALTIQYKDGRLHMAKRPKTW